MTHLSPSSPLGDLPLVCVATGKSDVSSLCLHLSPSDDGTHQVSVRSVHAPEGDALHSFTRPLPLLGFDCVLPALFQIPPASAVNLVAEKDADADDSDGEDAVDVPPESVFLSAVYSYRDLNHYCQTFSNMVTRAASEDRRVKQQQRIHNVEISWHIDLNRRRRARLLLKPRQLNSLGVTDGALVSIQYPSPLLGRYWSRSHPQ